MDQNQLIASVVQEVLKQIGPGKSVVSAGGSGGGARPGIFSSVNPAVETATRAQEQLANAGLKVRDGIVKLIKSIAKKNAEQWGRIEFEETKIGRLDHKIAKLQLLDGVPGVEFLKTAAHSGDNGIALDEAAPWGVIGVITPVTHSIPTLTANAISMIASGNAMVVNAHPSGAKCAAMAAAVYNQAIKEQFNIEPLICLVDPPTLESADAIFQHKGVPLLVVTGGPAVARAALKQQKRAIVAGPGNPPVVIDETADFDNAAKSIIAGAAFDNNLLCIGEKEVFVVASVFDKAMAAMKRAGAYELSNDQMKKLASIVFKFDKDHFALQKEYVGKDPWALAKLIGVDVPKSVQVLYGETDESNPFVSEEQMMPVLPFVRARDFNHALDLAIKHEHGFGHTAIIHSNNLANITRFGQAMNTTLLAVNGPCTACLGSGGEGYPSFSIATPTGEGVTTPLTFTRFRRVSVSGSMRIV